MIEEHQLIERVAQLETSVEGIRSDVSGLRSDFSAFIQSAQGWRRTNWSVIWSAVGVSFGIVAACAAALILPLHSQLSHTSETMRLKTEGIVGDIDREVHRLDTNLQREMRDRDEINQVLVETWKEQAKAVAARVDELSHAMIDHAMSPGHPVAMSLHRRVDNDLREFKASQRHLDDKLQKEMRELITSSANQARSELNAVDVKVQGEISAAADNVVARMDPLIAEINAAKADLASRRGQRFNMPDYERLVKPLAEKIQQMEQRLINIEQR